MQAKSKSKDYIPVTVPISAARGAGEPDKKSSRDISSWANATVWTDRMLSALVVGVRGGKWHALFEKVYSELNLFASARKVIGKQGAAGVDRQSTDDFSEHEMAEIGRLRQQLQQRTYRPQPVRRVQIPKPGSDQTRSLGIPTVRDRVVQTALVNVIEPIFDNEFHERSFGFRRGRSCHDALCVVEELLNAGHVFVVDADLQGYFDTIRRLTPRKSGQSIEATIAEINRTTVGWFRYFRHCTWNIFDKYDGMIRQRLRRQLLKRHRRNPERLCRTHRWPNAYFSARGYQSLRVSHTAYVQSLQGEH